jgi:hypothetical protein
MRIFRDISRLGKRDFGTDPHAFARTGLYKQGAARNASPRAHSNKANPGSSRVQLHAFSIIGDGEPEHLSYLHEVDAHLARFRVPGHVREGFLGDSE